MRRGGSKLLWLSLFITTSALADDYQWLEQVDGKRALAWVHQRNAESAEHFKSTPDFETFYQQARSTLNSTSRIPQVTQRGDYLYNFWRDETHPRGIYRRTTLEQYTQAQPQWETVLDIDALAQAEQKPWVMGGMSCLAPAYRHCLLRLSPGGGDAVEIREFDLHHKRFVTDGFNLPAAKHRASWVDQDTIFIATDFGPGSLTTSGYPRIAKRWQRGTSLSAAETLHSGQQGSVSVTATRLRGDDDSHVDLLNEGLDFWNNERYQIIGNRLQRLHLPTTATINGLYRGRLIISLKQDWRRGQQTLTQGSVILADPAALHQPDAPVEVLIQASDHAVVRSVTATQHGILVNVLDNVVSRLDLYHNDGGEWDRKAIDFPSQGSIALGSVDAASGEAFVSYQSFLTPPTLYHIAPPNWQPRKLKSQQPSFDATPFKAEQYWAQSADGTKVPYFMVHAKGLKQDGKNPTHIFSYGGFRNALTPTYSGTYESLSGVYGKLWLERGGVFVLANIRGGGEFGPRWHAAALKHQRHKAFEDFEAIADDLIARKITSARHIGIEGRSNGGLLVGALMNRRPHSYGAVICGVPLLDMQRYHRLLAGASWMGEYGNPDDEKDWAYLKTYSPYHNLKPDLDYPAVLFYTSTRDDRVHPGHARKMAAKMADMGYPNWYYENTEGGHGGSVTNDQLAYRVALAYSHLWSVLQ